MLFKRLIYIFLGSLLLWSCSEDENNGVQLKDTISSIEEINALIAETRFIIELPNGQSVDFIPSQQFRGPSFHSYTSVGNGFDFSSVSDPLVFNIEPNLGKSGTLNLGNETYRFPIVFCISADDLRDAYGFDFDSYFDDYEAYFAIESGDYREEEVVLDFAPVGVDNFLFYFLDSKENDLNTGNSAFYRKDQERFLLSGSFGIEGKALKCEGIASRFIVSFNGYSYLEYFGEFQSEIICN